MSNRLPENDTQIGFITAGVCLMVIAVLLLIFIDAGLKEIFGIGLLFIIGLGLTVAGSPDPRKDENDADPLP
jgi:hypothetical protein